MRIYLSGPFGKRKGLSDKQLDKNVQKAIKVAQKVIALGHHPEIPHLYWYVDKGWKDSPNEEQWYFIAASGLEGCEAILMFGDWKNSDGALRELRQARLLCLKVFHSLDEIKGV